MATKNKRSSGGSPMAIEEFLDYAISVSGTLDEIHKKGNIHGDIRPENIRSEPDSLKAE